MPRKSLVVKGSIAHAFQRAALQLGLKPTDTVTINDATEIAQTATARMNRDNKTRWSRIFLQPYLLNNERPIADGLALIAAAERGDAERLAKSNNA